jgi:diguanylate cyclase (GGDEF)-like protein
MTSARLGEGSACGISGLCAAVAVAGTLCWSSPASAQAHNFHHYDTDDGLTQVQVLAVHQDQTGHIWAGSYGGLSRYVGHSFYNYTTLDGLADNVIEALASDRHGRLWAGTNSGLCHFVDDEDSFRCKEDDSLQGVRVHVLHSGPEGLWIGTDQGLFLLDDDEVKAHYTHPGLPSSEVRSLSHDGGDNLWIGTSGGLVRYNRTSGQMHSLHLPADAGRLVSALLWADDGLWIGTELGLYRHENGVVRAAANIPQAARRAHVFGLTRDALGHLWAATSLGLLWQKKDGFHHLTTDNQLKFNVSFSITTDRDGLVWFGHDGGLSKWIPTGFSGYLDRHGLLESFVRTVNEDERGRLWLGTRAGVQIVPFDHDWAFEASTVITRDDGLIDDRVYSIDFPEPGRAFIATAHGVAVWQDDGGITHIYTDEHGLPVNQTQALLTDRSGRTWIGTNHGTVVLSDGIIEPLADPGLGQAYVYRFQEDTEGRIWAAARTGLFIVATDGRITHLGAEQGLSDATLWDIYPDPESGMWVGSNGDGLFHVRADGSIRNWSVEDGLADGSVWQVLVDERRHVWAYTNRGLSRLDGDRIRNYNRYDGLLHLEGGATGAHESHDGTLWFASADGLMRYDPKLNYPLPSPPQVVIERVELDGHPIAAGQLLPNRPGTLDFHYAALSYRSVSDLRYRYRLRGISEAWSEPIPHRPITFAGLGSGEFTFEVQARLPTTDWEDGTAGSFVFDIRRAYWETPWFWTLVVLGIVATMLLLLRWLTWRGEVRRRELEALVGQRTLELQRANQQLEDAAITDPLTGLHNRRYLLNQIDKDVAQSLRAHAAEDEYPNRDILFMMCDLDHFKKINDQHGHLTGDFLLRSVADLIKNQLRQSDYLVRWGGEEFLVVARNTEATHYNVIADRILQAIRQARFRSGEHDSEELTCTCSIGISHFPFVPENPQALNWEQVIDIADTALYMAKSEGRDRWVAIHRTDNTALDDGDHFLARIKTDIEALEREGLVEAERSAR